MVPAYRNLSERRQDIMRLHYVVALPWDKLETKSFDPEDGSMDWYEFINRWCDRQFGAEAFAWTCVVDRHDKNFMYWFTCEDHAFEFRMQFG